MAAVAAASFVPAMLLDASSTRTVVRSTCPASTVSAVASTDEPSTVTDTLSRSRAAPAGSWSTPSRRAAVPSEDCTWSMVISSAAWAAEPVAEATANRASAAMDGAILIEAPASRTRPGRCGRRGRSSRSRKRGRSPVEARWPWNLPCSFDPGGVVEQEHVLGGDDVALHAHDLRDGGDAAGAVLEPGLLDDQVDRAGDLLADGADRKVHAGHQDHGLETRERVARGVGVQGRDRAVVAGVHGLEHVERRGVTDLTDDDPVGTHAEGVLDQVADGDRALALDVGRARLEPEHVVLAQPQLGGVLDGHDALVVGDEGRQHVEGGGLAGTGTPGDQDVEAAADARLEQAGGRLAEAAEVDEVLDGVGVLGELADGQLGAVEGERRDDGVDTGAVGKSRVDHRAGLVHTPADLADDLVDRATQVRLVREGGAGLDELAAALDVDVVEGVDHDLGEVAVAQQRLQRSVAEDVVGRSPG